MQFPDDLSEQHFVIRQCAAVKNVLVQWYSVIVQDVFDIVSCKVNPEHLRVIFYIINILLDFFRLIKHHVSRSHHFLNTIEPEVCFTGCHIEDLIVSAALCPKSRQLRAFFQAISAAAAYDQRL